MASSAPTMLQRIVPRNEWFRGHLLRGLLCSIASALLLAAVLCDIYLATWLLKSGGEVRAGVGDEAELQKFLRDDIQRAVPKSTSTISGVYPDMGLVGLAWENRDTWFGKFMTWVCCRLRLLQDNMQALAVLVLFGAVLSWLRTWAQSGAEIEYTRYALDMASRLRRGVHRQTLRLGPSDLAGNEASHALQLFTQDVHDLRAALVEWFLRVGRDAITAGALGVLIFAVDPVLTLQCLLPVAGCWYIARAQKRRSDNERQVSDAQSEQDLRLLAESLTKTRLIRGYGMEPYEHEQFQKALDRFQTKTSAALATSSWSHRATAALVALCLSFTLFLIAAKVLLAPRDLSFAGGLLMACAAGAAWLPLQRLAHAYQYRDIIQSAALRIQAYLDRIPEVGQAVGAKFLQPLARVIEFEGVRYVTPTRKLLLDGLTIKIPAGRQVAIVATDPIESRALSYLLPRFIEPQAGRILIDGEDIAWVTLESLRAEVVFVGGKDPFLTGTVRENIAGNSKAFSLQDVTDAAKLVHAHHFILKLPQGYETVIGEHGEQLEHGQAFRLGLARAALRKPALLIIEEPIEHLDEDTKSLVDDAYQRLAPNRTIVYLPTRMSTLRRADEIVLLHRGKVEAVGPRSRLVNTSELYCHWEYLRFNEFRHEFEALPHSPANSA